MFDFFGRKRIAELEAQVANLDTELCISKDIAQEYCCQMRVAREEARMAFSREKQKCDALAEKILLAILSSGEINSDLTPDDLAAFAVRQADAFSAALHAKQSEKE